MPKHTFHFLNVKDGDCSIIEHGSGNVSVIDVCNAEKVTTPMSDLELKSITERISGNFQQKKHPVNPVEYLNKFNINSVFRFILTHPDMDHMDGIKDFFDCFNPANFWDTDNKKEIEFEQDAKYKEEDWNFYKQIRDGKSQTNLTRLTLFSGSQGMYYSQNAHGQPSWR